MKKCETLSKMLCHSSNLRNDDCKLKGETRIHKLCTLCDNFEVEDMRHIVLQCPYFDIERNSLFENIYSLGMQVSNALRDSPRDILYTILGGPLEGIHEEQDEKLRLITLRHAYHIYIRNTRIKIGVG